MSRAILHFIFVFRYVSTTATYRSVDAANEPDERVGPLVSVLADSLQERYKHDVSKSLMWSLHANKPDFVRLFIAQVSRRMYIYNNKNSISAFFIFSVYFSLLTRFYFHPVGRKRRNVFVRPAAQQRPLSP